MTSIATEPRIGFNRLAQQEGVHVSTVWRWALRGCKGHKLESFNVGGKKFTTLPAYDRWLAKLNGNGTNLPSTTRQREVAIDRAEKAAAELGI